MARKTQAERNQTLVESTTRELVARGVPAQHNRLLEIFVVLPNGQQVCLVSISDRKAILPEIHGFGQGPAPVLRQSTIVITRSSDKISEIAQMAAIRYRRLEALCGIK